jgi:hypothetical protein
MNMDVNAVTGGQQLAQEDPGPTDEEQKVLQEGFAQLMGSMMLNQQNIMSMFTNQILHDTIDDL